MVQVGQHNADSAWVVKHKGLQQMETEEAHNCTARIGTSELRQTEGTIVQTAKIPKIHITS